MAACYNCGHKFDRDFVVTRSAECPSCNRPIRCCKNCVFYEPGAHWDCRETIPDPVFEKERANFCDYFRFGAQAHSTSESGESRAQQARNDFDSLFS
jgi:hypothetical protein